MEINYAIRWIEIYPMEQPGPGVRETKWNKNYKEQCCMQ